MQRLYAGDHVVHDDVGLYRSGSGQRLRTLSLRCRRRHPHRGRLPGDWCPGHCRPHCGVSASLAALRSPCGRRRFGRRGLFTLCSLGRFRGALRCLASCKELVQAGLCRFGVALSFRTENPNQRVRRSLRFGGGLSSGGCSLGGHSRSLRGVALRGLRARALAQERCRVGTAAGGGNHQDCRAECPYGRVQGRPLA